MPLCITLRGLASATLLATSFFAASVCGPTQAQAQNPTGFQPPQFNAAAAEPATRGLSRPAEAYQTPRDAASTVQPAAYTTASVPPALTPVPTPQPARAAAPQQPPPNGSVSAASTTMAVHKPIPLPPRSGVAATAAAPRGVWQSVVSTVFALLLVLGVFGSLAVLIGRNRRGPAGSLPPQVFEVLGRSACMPRQQVLVVRFGPKLLLVSHEPGNVQTLSEIDSPTEVDRLAGLCEQQRAGSVTANFQHVLQSVVQGRSPDRPTKRWFAAGSPADAA